ncbi:MULTISPECIES: MogA/MoaB family molybdenum cofactor biosynthesis protein [Corynebacterium]|jgi:molybdopterin biosynthesis enzyme MoaB|uniref:Molybdenum cofactor biosynthesis protein B n=1 Tax=Corynebacterium provencense TaxID=1737425 RepID=A0A2Z3YML4_9CORY|nr:MULTISPECIES: molybdopterin-binding protein [Corynebacterium]AWT25442.1 Molybdenum cofactor biosynthesis protein B [Corynebacterium provencense]MCI1256172.1 molybdopterin-binding protein [Corynebacterium provencense]
MTTALVIVASTRAAAGEYTDRTGPVLVEWLRGRGLTTPDPVVVADRDIPGFLGDLFAGDPPTVILTTGGTGISPGDRTVAAVKPHLTHELPGLPAAVWRRGQDAGVPTALLSGGVAGVVGRSFVMTLPGSTGGVADGVAVLDPVLSHLIDQLEGEGDHE